MTEAQRCWPAVIGVLDLDPVERPSARVGRQFSLCDHTLEVVDFYLFKYQLPDAFHVCDIDEPLRVVEGVAQTGLPLGKLQLTQIALAR